MVPVQIVLTAAVFLGVLLATSFLWWSWQTRQDARKQQLAMRVGSVMDDSRLLRLREADEAARGRGRWRNHLARTLRSAGDERRPRDLLLAMGVMAASGLFFTFWVLPFPGALAGALVGLVPYLAVAGEGRRRSQKLTEQLPDALDLISRALRAGRAFGDALRLAATELPAPVGEELVQVSEEHRLGIDLRDSLSNLLVRNPRNWDLRLFVGSVLLQRETGGNLIEMMDHLAETIRERLIFESKVEALTAEVRFSAWVLGVLPFLVASILLLVQPLYLVPLLTTHLGRIMLTFGAVSLTVGALTMRRLAHLEAA
jgi:tight adherence protein B